MMASPREIIARLDKVPFIPSNAVKNAAGETPDGAVISGRDSLSGGEVESATDHRCAMSLAVAALRARDPVTIKAVDNVATSFPGFENLAISIGIQIEILE